MQEPLQLEIEGFELPAHLKELIESNVAKLERSYGRITSCRAAIRAPNEHHKMGEPYVVSIRLSLPDHRIVNVKPTTRGLDRRQADVAFAVTDAFRRADRQLRSFTSQHKGRQKLREHEPEGTILRIDPGGEFGFLQSDDDREIYFHANSVLGSTISHLKQGMRVSFHEEAGEKGPQASTVRVTETVRRRR